MSSLFGALFKQAHAGAAAGAASLFAPSSKFRSEAAAQPATTPKSADGKRKRGAAKAAAAAPAAEAAAQPAPTPKKRKAAAPPEAKERAPAGGNKGAAVAAVAKPAVPVPAAAGATPKGRKTRQSKAAAAAAAAAAPADAPEPASAQATPAAKPAKGKKTAQPAAQHAVAPAAAAKPSKGKKAVQPVAQPAAAPAAVAKPAKGKQAAQPAAEPVAQPAAAPAAAEPTAKPAKSKDKRKKAKPAEAAPAAEVAPDAAAPAARPSAAEEAAKLQRTVFVGNLPAGAKRKALARVFSQYGVVESARLRCVPVAAAGAKLPRRAAMASGQVDAARGSAHAYVVFKEAAAAEAALAHNMREWEGNHLRVDRAGVNGLKARGVKKGGGAAAARRLAAAAPAVQYDPERSVFVGNLHIEAEDEEVVRFFLQGVGGGGAPQLEAVRLVRDPKTSVGKGIAFVLFRTRAGRRAALALDGRELRGRPLRVTPIKAGGGGGGGGSAAGASWQGTAASRSGRLRGPLGTGQSSSRPAKGAKRKGDGKRPAVAARKARALGAAAAGVQKRSGKPARR